MRLLLADDHPIVLDALERLFLQEADIELVASCRDGAEALTAIRSERPDVALLDLSMPRLTGLEVLQRMREDRPPTRIVLLAASISEEAAMEAIGLGAKGVALKELPPELIVRCVREVHAGRCWFERNLAGQALERLLASKPREPDAVRLLTPRELEIVDLVATGCRNKEIAYRLAISEGTVKIHLNRIYEKLLISNRVELANFAHSERLPEYPAGRRPLLE